MSYIPPGLEDLMMVDQLLIKENVKDQSFRKFKASKKAVIEHEMPNSYEILNQHGKLLFYAQEKSDSCSRNCCGATREFEMKVVDKTGQEVIVVDRPLRCDCWLWFCCLQKCTIMSPRGNAVGHIKQQIDICNRPRFAIFDGENKLVLRIEGPCLTCGTGDITFNVLALDGVVVGKVFRKWSGIVNEFFTDADIFGISFPMDLDVKIKATIIGACFLIQFNYFEALERSRRI